MRRVYLDYATTTPIHSRVREVMLPYLQTFFGNTWSFYQESQKPREAVDEARCQVAALIGAKSEEIIFTSGGTEADNLAIKGVGFANQKRGNHIVTSQIERQAVLYSLKFLEKLGFTITYLPVDKEGIVNSEDVAAAITEKTILVSVMYGNHEVGTLEPIAEIGQITREKEVYFHTDATQVAGILPIEVNRLGIDLLSLSGHKFYGPKGIGALYVREGTKLQPLIHGGIQEEGWRAGTENISGIVGLGKAAEMARNQMSERIDQILSLRNRLSEALLKKVTGIHINGHSTHKLPHYLSLSVEFVKGDALTLLLDRKGVAVSPGSTCTFTARKPSHVLRAMGVPLDLAEGTLLFSTGIFTTEEDIEYVTEIFPEAVEKLRSISTI
jgi:cysteine desulfurase